MNDAVRESGSTFNASRYLPILFLLFAASGCSALIYEIVWYQLLQLAIGSTAVSLGILLATFCVIETAWMFVYAGGGSRLAAWLRSGNRMRWFNRASGGVFIGAGEIGRASCRERV